MYRILLDNNKNSASQCYTEMVRVLTESGVAFETSIDPESIEDFEDFLLVPTYVRNREEFRFFNYHLYGDKEPIIVFCTMLGNTPCVLTENVCLNSPDGDYVLLDDSITVFKEFIETLKSEAASDGDCEECSSDIAEQLYKINLIKSYQNAKNSSCTNASASIPDQ